MADRMMSVPKVFGPGATLYVALVASAMILGVGALQVTRSYSDAMNVAFRAVEARGRSVTKLTDSSLCAVDLVVSALAEDLTAGVATPALPDMLDRRLRQIDQASDLVIVAAGRRWQSHVGSGAPLEGVETPSLAWHHLHPADPSLHLEVTFGAGFPGHVAIVLSRAVREREGTVSGIVAAVLSPTLFENLYGEMIVGRQGAISLWRDDHSALMRFPPAPDKIGRVAVSEQFSEVLRGHGVGAYRARNSAVDGKDRLIAYNTLDHFPMLVVTTSYAVEDVVMPWLGNEIAQVAAVSFCIAVLVGMGVVMARHRRRQSEAERLRRSGEALFRGVFDHSTDNLFVYRRIEDATFIIEAINPAAARMAGLPPSEILGRRATDVLPSRIAARVEADLNATIASKAVVRFESESSNDGRLLVNEVVQVPLANADGILDRVFVGARDITHLKTADARLSELNERLVLAEKIAHVGHWRIDLPSRAVFWSDEVYRIYGLEPTTSSLGLDEAIEAYHPDDRAELLRLFRKAVADKREFDYTLRLVRPDGEIRHVTSRCLLDLRPDGEISAIFGTVMDVTDLKHVERRLEEQSGLLKTTLAHMEQGLVMFDAAGEIVVRNARAVELLGDAVGVISVPGLAEGGAGRRFEVAGRILDVRSVTVPGGGAVMTYTDATDLQRTEKSLRDSEARYRLLAENTSELIQLGHDDGRRSYISPAIERLLGFTVAEFSAMRLRDYVHPDDLQEFYATTRRLGTAVEVSTTYRALHKTRGWIWVEGVFRRIPDARGDEPTIVGTFRDVGERLYQAEALQRAKELAERAQAEAERASAAKTDFLASMSHEIRTPLTGVLGYTELLLDDVDLSAAQRRNVERIQNAGTALLTIVNDILDFSKIEAGQIDLELASFNIETLMDNAISIVRSVADRKCLSLAVTIDPAMPRHLVGDQDRLRQVLLNLLNNAVKFTPAGGIHVEVTAEGRVDHRVRARFSVTDTGIGIPVDKRRYLFERFSQVDGSIARRFGGTGLGLAISKSLVAMMGGDIAVESADGGGSTFWFSVPLTETSVPTVELVPSESVTTTNGGGAKILLVDDLEINRDLGMALLVAAGHSVDAVGDGAEAIMAVQAKRYDLVLMDVQMPGMDGVTATLHIRSLPGEVGRIPIIAMTANVLPDQIAQCRKAGMDDHVGKPVKRSALQAVIERYRGRACEPDLSHDGAATILGRSNLDVGILDVAMFEEMRGLLGGDAMRLTLARFSDHLDGEFADALQGSTEPGTIARSAHKVISMAGSLGFKALSMASADLEQACLEGQRLDGTIRAARAACRAAIERIVVLRTA